MTKVLEITDKQALRIVRDTAWNENAENWSTSRVLPESLKKYLFTIVSDSLKNENDLLVDIGCGNAWLADFIINDIGIRVEYLGLDNNNYFIENNNKRYESQNEVNFINVDLEKTIDLKLKNNKKCFIACLSFIELIDLDKSYRNVTNMMNSDERLSLVVLDPNFEIFRMSDTFENLESNMLSFFNNKQSYYKKEIISDKTKSFKKEYIGLLHKVEDYIEKASLNGLSLLSIENINCYNKINKKGTIYKVFNFIKD